VTQVFVCARAGVKTKESEISSNSDVCMSTDMLYKFWAVVLISVVWCVCASMCACV